MDLFTFDINHIIKEPNGLHVQEVAYAGSSNLYEGGRGSGCHTQEPLQHSQPNAAAHTPQHTMQQHSVHNTTDTVRTLKGFRSSSSKCK